MKKRIFSILLTLCMVLALCPVTAFADVPPDTIVGDINLDGTVTIRDAILLQNYLEGLESFTNEQLVVADFNGDGVVNYSDLTELQSYLKLPASGITVENGKATAGGTEIGKAAKGTRVTLTANSPSDDMEFDKWIVNEGGVTLADASSATTTFTMSEDPVSVTATYKPLSASETGSLAITVDGFEVGKTPADCTYSFESTIPGVTFSEDDIQLVDYCVKLVIPEGGTTWVPMYETEAFEAGVSYWILMNLDNKGLDMAPAVTVNGKTREDCTIATSNGVPIQLQILCELGTPAMPPITVTADFTTTVKQGGSAAPGETAFELELVNERGEKLSFDDVKVTGSVITNGKGSYKSDMTFTGSLEDLYRMLGQGAFVKQVDAGEDGWTVDDTVWGLRLRNAAERAVDDAAPEYTVLIFPATKNTDDGGLSYSMVDGANQVERMTFTNTYTKSTTVLIDPAGLTDQTNPQTGDNSHMALWMALLFISGGLLTATAIKGAETEQKRRKRHE